MKDLDRQIKDWFFSSLLVSGIVCSIILGLQPVLFIIGIALGLGFGCFLIGHLALGMPSFGIVCFWRDILDKPIMWIEEYSKILMYTFSWLTILPLYLLTIFTYTYIMYVCIKYQVDIDGYWALMVEVMSMDN
jgi:hypothetical protein